MTGICTNCGKPARPWCGRGRHPLTCEACRLADARLARKDYEVKRRAWRREARRPADNPHARQMRDWRKRTMRAAGKTACPDCGRAMWRLNLAGAERVRCPLCRGRLLAASIGRGPMARAA